MISLYLPLSPIETRQQLEYGDLVAVRDIRRLFILHKRAAKATPLLLKDGWTIWFTGAGLKAEHPVVASRKDAEGRLAALGLPLVWLEVSDDSRFRELASEVESSSLDD